MAIHPSSERGDGLRRGGFALTVIAGLGGRAILMSSLQRVFVAAGEDKLLDVQFLDINQDSVDHELERASKTRHSGPTAESILRQQAKRKGVGQ